MWAVALTRDGIPSRFAGPRSVTTGPQPLVVPTLTVAVAAGEDQASWTALAVPADVAIERSVDSGVTWTRVSPWLPETTSPRSFTIPSPGGSRQYRLVLRGSRDRRVAGPGVTPT